MGKTFSIILITVLLIGSPTRISASDTRDCEKCHTMHDSQNAQSVTGAGPRPALLNTAGKTSCWGCHAQGTTDNIDFFTGAPQVMHTNDTDLAGGNFAYVTGDKAGITGGTKTRGHNIKDSDVIDDNFSSGNYPPGDEFSQSSNGFDNTTFTCAGKFGCHGNRAADDEYVAIWGSHHTNDSVLKFGSIDESSQGGTVGTSFRFLLGVKGGEDSDWEKTVSASDHNEYKGAINRGSEGTMTSPGGNTISGLCAECHGNFHGTGNGDLGNNSPWLRHPTDIELPGSGEYADYNAGNGNEYSLEAPVARVTIPNNAESTVTPGDGNNSITCLSCHRAHASPYKDILRWNYEDMVAGGGGADGTGCFICHTAKDGV